MSNPFTLTFKLKQHTPIIHFQHDQAGATLRATEIKPKLDRMVIKKMGGLDAVKKEHADWFLSQDKSALDYKMKISSKMPDKYVVASRLPGGRQSQKKLQEKGYGSLSPSPFFALEKETGKLVVENPRQNKDQPRSYSLAANFDELMQFIDKLGVMSYEPIEMQVHSFHLALLQTIRDLICTFFVVENFGSRQSKGFGSYTVEQIDGKAVSYDVPSMLKSQFSFVYKKQMSNKELDEIFNQISKDYKLLKSGRNPNEGGRYVKSKLFNYAVTQPNPLRWEKRDIKKKIKDNYSHYNRIEVDRAIRSAELEGDSPPAEDIGKKGWKDSYPYEYAFIRVVLGLAEQYEFLVKNIKDLKFVVSISSRDGIERFRSPLIFKVIGSNIYLAGSQINPEILSSSGAEKWFDFSLSLKSGKNPKARFHKIEQLTSLPTPSQFDLEDFVRDALYDPADEQIEGYKRL